MASSKDNKLKELWVGWTRDAISKYVPPDGKLDNDELVDDMVDVATKYADAMLDVYEEQFEGVKRPAARKRKRRDEEEEEVEDDDEDDDEDEDDE